MQINNSNQISNSMEMTKTLQQNEKEITSKANAEDQEKGPQLSLFKNPLLTLYYFSFVVLDLLKKIANFALRNLVWISFIVAFLIVPRLFDHPYYHVLICTSFLLTELTY